MMMKRFATLAALAALTLSSNLNPAQAQAPTPADLSKTWPDAPEYLFFQALLGRLQGAEVYLGRAEAIFARRAKGQAKPLRPYPASMTGEVRTWKAEYQPELDRLEGELDAALTAYGFAAGTCGGCEGPLKAEAEQLYLGLSAARRREADVYYVALFGAPAVAPTATEPVDVYLNASALVHALPQDFLEAQGVVEPRTVTETNTVTNTVNVPTPMRPKWAIGGGGAGVFDKDGEGMIGGGGRLYGRLSLRPATWVELMVRAGLAGSHLRHPLATETSDSPRWSPLVIGGPNFFPSRLFSLGAQCGTVEMGGACEGLVSLNVSRWHLRAGGGFLFRALLVPDQQQFGADLPDRRDAPYGVLLFEGDLN